LQDLRAVGPLVSALKDSDWWVRKSAAGSLGKLKAPRAIAPLEVLLTDPDESVRSAAAEALKTIRGEEPPK
jgi:HEAT repeat protein